MAYASESGMKDVFGSKNIDEWADLNNTEVGAEITARIARAVVVADAYTNGYLRGVRYAIPVTEQDGSTTPTIIADVADKFAGVWLAESRGVKDLVGRGGAQHRYIYLRRDARRTLLDIREGRIILDSP